MNGFDLDVKFDMEKAQPIVKEVWDGKYRFKKPDGSSDELNPYFSHARVVRHVFSKDVSSSEALLDWGPGSGSVLDFSEPAVQAYVSMCEGYLAPAGRVHAGAGTGRLVTLINCFVSPDIEDSMETEVNKNSKGILDSLSVAALTQRMGGGIGMNFNLRPRGAVVKRVGSVASGNLHFMDMWNAMCSTIMSSGSRRGAMMATMSCTHPDLLEFIEAKKEPGRLTNFNVSVLVTDDFMEAIRNDEHWDLYYHVPPASGDYVTTFEKNGKNQYVYCRMSARDLWELIARTTYDYAEPGIVYIDRVNQWNNLWYCEYINATNPCGEQPLPPNGDCDLIAVNLAFMVEDPFGDNPQVDLEAVKKTTRLAVRFADNVLDTSAFPTADQQEEARQKRRIGVGIMGLGNLLQQLKIRYGSEDAIQATKLIQRIIRDEAYWTSIELAKERGPFPAFDRDKYLQGKFIKTLPEAIQSAIAEHGIRNGVLLDIAPTGTTAIYYGNVSGGLEPPFSLKYDRKVLQPDGTLKKFGTVEDYGYRLFKEKFPEYKDGDPLPDYMVTAGELTVREHLVMQAACQKYIDASISKTINCPESMTFEEFEDVYSMAYDMGCKGCTTYRPSEIARKTRGSVLSVGDEDEDRTSSLVPVIKRPQKLSGETYKVTWPGLGYAFYVTINDHKENGKLRPFEIFINSKSVKHQEWIIALTRTISAIFRRGGDVEFLIEELEQVHSAQGGYWVDGRYVPSMVAMIGLVIKDHFQEIGLLSGDDKLDKLEIKKTPNVEGSSEVGEICPKCQAPTLFEMEGCETCGSCGFSSCA